MSVNIERQRRTTPVTSLGQLQSEQANRLVQLGFQRDLGMSVEGYKASLPGFLARPKDKLFDFPLLVDPRVSLKRQGEMVGVRVDKTYLDVVDVPLTPYTEWFRLMYFHFDIEKYISVHELTTIESTLGTISSLGEPGTSLELLSMRIHFPELATRGPKIIFGGGSRSRDYMAVPGFTYKDPWFVNSEIDRPWPAFSHNVGYYLLVRSQQANMAV